MKSRRRKPETIRELIESTPQADYAAMGLSLGQALKDSNLAKAHEEALEVKWFDGFEAANQLNIAENERKPTEGLFMDAFKQGHKQGWKASKPNDGINFMNGYLKGAQQILSGPPHLVIDPENPAKVRTGNSLSGLFATFPPDDSRFKSLAVGQQYIDKIYKMDDRGHPTPFVIGEGPIYINTDSMKADIAKSKDGTIPAKVSLPSVVDGRSTYKTRMIVSTKRQITNIFNDVKIPPLIKYTPPESPTLNAQGLLEFAKK